MSTPARCYYLTKGISQYRWLCDECVAARRADGWDATQHTANAPLCVDCDMRRQGGAANDVPKADEVE
jgi:hypothetical protein